MPHDHSINRRNFLGQSAAVGAAVAIGVPAISDAQATPSARRIKVGVIGCGSVSRMYLPHLAECPFVELVCTCDKIPDRARLAADKFHISQHYPHMEQMLSGTPSTCS